VNIKTNPTALEFSPEGGAIYLGTDDGKLLVVDLRNLDKPAKMIIVSEIGDPIRTLSILVEVIPTFFLHPLVLILKSFRGKPKRGKTALPKHPEAMARQLLRMPLNPSLLCAERHRVLP
jgi:hypothetical protein